MSYNHDDNYYGLGSSTLTANPRTDDWKKEAKYIKDELKRLNNEKVNPHNNNI